MRRNEDLTASQRLFRASWGANLYRTIDGAPVVPAEFVIELGREVQVIDVRDEAELDGPIGHVAGATWVPIERIDEVAGVLADDTPVVVVSNRGRRSARAALRLEELGMRFVASMRGGMVVWKGLGLDPSRDPKTLRRELGEVPAEVAGRPASVTIEMIREQIGDPGAIRWAKMAAFLMQSRISCVDGRDDHGIVGTPGGDAGEVLLAMAAIEALTDRALDQAAVGQLLAGYVRTFGSFYMHTDLHALQAWVAVMRADPRLAGRLPEEPPGTGSGVWQRWLRRPPPELQEAVLESVVAPAHIGCGHIRLMTQHAADYGIRQELVLAFLRAFFRLRWAGEADVDYVILAGDHQESAVVVVRLEDQVWPFSRVPLIRPAGVIQIFVDHPQVVSFLRRQTAGHFALQPITGLLPGDHERLFERIEELAASQLSATLGRLAQGLPLFEALFKRDGSYEVRALS